MRFEAERAREQAQRQLAAAEGRAGVLQTRVDDVLADNRALRHKASRDTAVKTTQKKFPDRRMSHLPSLHGLLDASDTYHEQCPQVSWTMLLCHVGRRHFPADPSMSLS